MDYNHTEFEFIIDTSCKIYEGTDLETQKKMRIIDLVNPGTMTAYQTWSGDTLFINNSNRRVFDVSPQYFFNAIEVFNEKEKSSHHEYKPTIVIKDKDTHEVHFAVVERFQTLYANNNTDMSSDDCDCINYGNLGIGFRLYCDNNFTDLVYNKNGERSDELPITGDNHLNVTINFSPLPYCDIDYGMSREVHPFGHMAYFGYNEESNKKRTNYFIAGSTKNITKALFSRKNISVPGTPKREFNFIIDDHCTIEKRDNKDCIVIKNPKLIKAYQIWSKGGRGYNTERRYISYISPGELVAQVLSINNFLKFYIHDEIHNPLFKFTPTAYVEYQGEKYFVVISDVEYNRKNHGGKFSTSIEPELVLKLRKNLLCSYDHTPCAVPSLTDNKHRIYINIDPIANHGDINYDLVKSVFYAKGLLMMARLGNPNNSITIDPYFFFNLPYIPMYNGSNSKSKSIVNKSKTTKNNNFIKDNKFVFNLENNLSLVKRSKSDFQIKLKNDNDITDYDFDADADGQQLQQTFEGGEYTPNPLFFQPENDGVNEFTAFQGSQYKLKIGGKQDQDVITMDDPNNRPVFYIATNTCDVYKPQPKLRLFIGITYSFDVSDDSFNVARANGVPFDIKFAGNPDGANEGLSNFVPLVDTPDGNGIRAGSEGAEVIFTPSYNTPTTIYYYDQGTTQAGNLINIQPLFTIRNNTGGDNDTPGGDDDNPGGDDDGGDTPDGPDTPTNWLAWLGLLGLLALIPPYAMYRRSRERRDLQDITGDRPVRMDNPAYDGIGAWRPADGPLEATYGGEFGQMATNLTVGQIVEAASIGRPLSVFSASTDEAGYFDPTILRAAQVDTAVRGMNGSTRFQRATNPDGTPAVDVNGNALYAAVMETNAEYVYPDNTQGDAALAIHAPADGVTAGVTAAQVSSARRVPNAGIQDGAGTAIPGGADAALLGVTNMVDATYPTTGDIIDPAAMQQSATYLVATGGGIPVLVAADGTPPPPTGSFTSYTTNARLDPGAATPSQAQRAADGRVITQYDQYDNVPPGGGTRASRIVDAARAAELAAGAATDEAVEEIQLDTIFNDVPSGIKDSLNSILDQMNGESGFYGIESGLRNSGIRRIKEYVNDATTDFSSISTLRELRDNIQSNFPNETSVVDNLIAELISNLNTEVGLVDSLKKTKQLGDELKPENFQLVGNALKDRPDIIRADATVEQLSQAVSDAFKETLSESSDLGLLREYINRSKFSSNEKDFLIERLRINLANELEPFAQTPGDSQGLMNITSNIATQIVEAPKAVEVIRDLKAQVKSTIEGRLEMTTQGRIESFVEKWNRDHPTEQLTDTDAGRLELELVDAIENIDFEIPADAFSSELFDNASAVENYFGYEVQKVVGETLINEFSKGTSFSALDDTAKIELFGGLVDSVTKFPSPEEPYDFEVAFA